MVKIFRIEIFDWRDYFSGRGVLHVEKHRNFRIIFTIMDTTIRFL